MPLFWISLAFLCGILLSRSLAFPILGWSLLALLAFILLLPPIYRRLFSRFSSYLTHITKTLKLGSPALFPLIILFLCVGAIRYQLAQPTINPAFIAYYNDQSTEYIIDAVVVEPPDVRDTYINLRLHLEQLKAVSNPADASQFIPVQGLLLARVSRSTTFNYGDLIRLQGHLETPPENEDFSYRDYLANRGIYSYMAYPATSLLQQGKGNPVYSALYTFRQHGIELIYSLYPDPEASLLAGIILGVQSGIPQSVQEAFRLTGTSHIIVISGFNITIIAGLFTLLFSRLLGERKGAVVAALGIIIYTLLVGANAAVVRAAILGMLTLLGHQLGRRQLGLNSLSFVAAGMALINPTVLWDVSFQLSFAATLGIMLYAEPFTQWFTNFAARFIPRDTANRLAGPAGEYFLLTLAAQLTTLPLMAYYFKRISLTALIANPLILPAQPALEVLGGLSVLFGMIYKPIGQLLAWAAWPFTAYTIRVVEWLAAVPHGSISLGQVAFPLITLFYVVLFGITFARSRLPSLVTRLTPAIPLTMLAIIAALVWKAAFYAPDGLLHAFILDVGTADAVLIQSPFGRSVLINGGPSTIALSDALGRRLPPFDRSLDWLIIADIDAEDLAGIPANLERFTPTNVLWAGNTYGTRSAQDLWTQLISQSIPTTLMQSGQALDLGSGASLSVLSIDARGADLLLKWGNFRLVLPMGIDFTALETLRGNSAMRSVSALLLAESGYAPLNPPDFISFLHPQLALLSVAPADKTGLPSPETLDALRGYNLLRTDQNGWIELTTNGTQMWVEVEKR
jgi:competence protein ComEC